MTSKLAWTFSDSFGSDRDDPPEPIFDLTLIKCWPKKGIDGKPRQPRDLEMPILELSVAVDHEGKAQWTASLMHARGDGSMTGMDIALGKNPEDAMINGVRALCAFAPAIQLPDAVELAHSAKRPPWALYFCSTESVGRFVVARTCICAQRFFEETEGISDVTTVILRRIGKVPENAVRKLPGDDWCRGYPTRDVLAVVERSVAKSTQKTKSLYRRGLIAAGFEDAAARP